MITGSQTQREEPFPTVPDALLAALDALFPERCAELSDDEKTIRYKAGQRHVVRFLKEKHKQQNENILTKT